MWRWLVLQWKHMQQKTDLAILWPSMKDIASAMGDANRARQAFRMHMELDPAYNYMTAAERDDYVRNLPP